MMDADRTNTLALLDKVCSCFTNAQMKSQDSDFRYMALNDLAAIVDRKSSFSPVTDGIEEMTVKQILDLLHDKNTEVKNLAVNTLVSIVNKVSLGSYELIIKNLVKWVLSSDEEKRDIAVLTLRSIVDVVISSPTLARSLVSEVSPAIVAQLKSASASHVQQNDAFDVLNSILFQLPLSVVQFPELHQEVLDTLLVSLLSPRSAISKRAVTGIGSYSSIASPEIFSIIITRILEILRSPPETNSKWLNVRTIVQLIAVLARNTSRRLRSDAPTLVQSILEVLSVVTSQESDTAEVSETCLQAIGALFSSSVAPGSIALGPVVDAALTMLRYDPNYAGYDYDEDDVLEDDDELVVENYSDDDDLSWKVRRAAAKCLAVIISKQLSFLGDLLVPISASLVSAVLEREETVRLEVFSTFTTLLEQLHHEDVDVITGSMDMATSNKRKRSADDLSTKQADVCYIEPQLANAVQNLCKQAESRSLPTRIGSIDVLSQLIAVFGPSFTPYTDPIFATLYKTFQGINSASNVQGKSLSLAVVGLIEQMCVSVPAQLPQELPFVVDFLVKTMLDTNHRNAIAVLRTGALLVRCVFPIRLDNGNDIALHLQRIYDASVARLERDDSDQLLKNACINTIGVLVSSAGDRLDERLGSALSIILARLPFEVTRASCIAVIREIILSARVRELTEVHHFALESIEPLLGLTRLSDHSSVDASLGCLREIVSTLRTRIPHGTLLAIVHAIEKNAEIDREAEYSVSLLTLADLVVQIDASMIVTLERVFLPTMYNHLASPLLPASVLEALVSLLGTVGRHNDEIAFATVTSLLSVWSTVCAEQGNKMENRTAFLAHAPLAFAQCISAVSSSYAVANAALHRAVVILRGNIADSVLGLYVLGSLGYNGTLARWSETGAMFDTALGIYASNDDRNVATAYALGGLLLSAPDQFLPRIYELLQSADVSLRLQGLRIVREALAHATMETLASISMQLWPRVASVGEELELNEASQALFDTCYECLARMVFSNPAHYVDSLKQAACSPSASVRALVLGAVRSTLSLDRMRSLDTVLSPSLWRFLLLLDDENVTVCRLAVMALHSALYNRNDIVFEHFGTLIPKLLQHTAVREELKRKVAMGPFTVVIDDGLDLRKVCVTS